MNTPLNGERGLLKLACMTCGHWAVDAFSKEDIAAWLRVHPGATMHPNAAGPVRASICPHPCGTPLPTPSDEPCGIEGCRICPAVFGSQEAGS